MQNIFTYLIHYIYILFGVLHVLCMEMASMQM